MVIDFYKFVNYKMDNFDCKGTVFYSFVQLLGEKNAKK